MTRPTLACFEGEWRLSREIRDFRASRTGRMEGVARFTREGDALRCRESGTLSFDGAPGFRAERETIWRAEGPRVAVAFADGRPFHVFDPAGPAEAVHDCPPDRYRVRYDFAGWPDWRAVWRVTGPRKDYEMETRYRPLAGAVEAAVTPDP